MKNSIEMLNIAQVNELDLVRLTLQGALTLYTAGKLKAAIAAAQGRSNRIRLDMSGIGFVDSSGIGVLARISRELAAAGGSLELARVQEQFATVLKLTGLQSFFRIEHQNLERT